MGSSDHELYNLFNADPRLLDVFVELNPSHSYTFESVTFKKLARTCDGRLKSTDPDEAVVIIEFQMQKKADIYTRIFLEMGMYRNENPNKGVRGIIVFKDRETDPGDQVWEQVAHTCPGLLKVLYLNEIYEDLKRTQPNTPLQIVFAPFVETDRNLIRQNAQKWMQQLTLLPYEEAHRETFIDVFMSWLTNSLPDTTEKELIQMASLTFDISHTRFFKDVSERIQKEIGERERRIGEKAARLEQLKEMLGEGAITHDYYNRKVKALTDQNTPYTNGVDPNGFSHF